MPVRFLDSVLILVLALLGCERKPPVPTNVILITVDTLRPDRIGAYGMDAAGTPHIDALARRGTLFARAYSPMGRTTPALASLMTGLWPHHHGAREVAYKVEHGTFLTSPLKEAGFTTIGVSANPVAGQKYGFATDFDYFEEQMSGHSLWVTGKAVEQLRAVPQDKRLFLWAHYYDPHWAYFPPPDWRREDAGECDSLMKMSRGLRESNGDGSAARALPSCWSAYQSEVVYADHGIGKLLEALRAEGRLDNSLIVFTADHGESFGENGTYYAHGLDAHDADVRVPLIVAGPGVRRDARRNEVIRLVDLAPTILSIMGIPLGDYAESPGIDGEDLSHLLRSWWPDRDERLTFAESGNASMLDDYTHLLSGRPRAGYCINEGDYSLCWKDDAVPAMYDRSRDPRMENDLKETEPDRYQAMMAAKRRWPPGSARHRSVSDGRFKLVESPRFEGGFAQYLWDLETDPLESVDVRDEHPRVFARLEKALSAWTTELPEYRQAPLTKEQEAQLRALGYIQ
jgi:arylsulfatase